jgi:hypothetical protein
MHDRAATEEDTVPSRMEEVASKAAGAFKAAKAAIEGLHGIFRQLTVEHGEVSARIMRVKLTSDPKVRRELFPTIRMELLSHEKGELQELYPVFEKYTELAGMAAEHKSDADKLAQCLAALSETNFEADAWGSRFGELVALVNHHVTEEEGTYFPKASRIIGKEQAEEILARYKLTKAQVMQQMSGPM